MSHSSEGGHAEGVCGRQWVSLSGLEHVGEVGTGQPSEPTNARPSHLHGVGLWPVSGHGLQSEVCKMVMCVEE